MIVDWKFEGLELVWTWELLHNLCIKKIGLPNRKGAGPLPKAISKLLTDSRDERESWNWCGYLRMIDMFVWTHHFCQRRSKQKNTEKMNPELKHKSLGIFFGRVRGEGMKFRGWLESRCFFSCNDLESRMKKSSRPPTSAALGLSVFF